MFPCLHAEMLIKTFVEAVAGLSSQRMLTYSSAVGECTYVHLRSLGVEVHGYLSTLVCAILYAFAMFLMGYFLLWSENIAFSVVSYGSEVIVSMRQ